VWACVTGRFAFASHPAIESVAFSDLSTFQTSSFFALNHTVRISIGSFDLLDPYFKASAQEVAEGGSVGISDALRNLIDAGVAGF